MNSLHRQNHYTFNSSQCITKKREEIPLNITAQIRFWLPSLYFSYSSRPSLCFVQNSEKMKSCFRGPYGGSLRRGVLVGPSGGGFTVDKKLQLFFLFVVWQQIDVRLKAERMPVLTHVKSCKLDVFLPRYTLMTADSTFTSADTLEGFKIFFFLIILMFLLDFCRINRTLKNRKFSFTNSKVYISSKKYYLNLNRRAFDEWRFNLFIARRFMFK